MYLSPWIYEIYDKNSETYVYTSSNVYITDSEMNVPTETGTTCYDSNFEDAKNLVETIKKSNNIENYNTVNYNGATLAESFETSQYRVTIY